jgi:2-haloalkanoic acid dehalogenase type II
MARDGIKDCTFGRYGTLIDWDGGLGMFLYDLVLRRGDQEPPNGRVLRERWEAIRFGQFQGPYRRYEEVLAESLRHWCDERGYDWDPADGVALARSMRSWQPFKHTNPALTLLRAAGVRLVIISNTDEAIIAHSLRHLELPFDGVITAESCGAYKPSPRVFEQAKARVGAAAETVLHVGFGFNYDNAPAQAIGWHAAWINRDADEKPGNATPDYEFRDLWELADYLVA